MPISADYLDETSEISIEFLSPIKQILENDAVLKTIRIFARFQTNGLNKDSIDLNSTCTQMKIMEATYSDVEIFNLFKTSISEPADPNNRIEAGLTKEELLQHRDPLGIRLMPINSEFVKNLIAEFRIHQRKELALTPFGRVQEQYSRIIKMIEKKRANQPFTLNHLEITIVYTKKSDQSKDLTFTATAQ